MLAKKLIILSSLSVPILLAAGHFPLVLSQAPQQADKPTQRTVTTPAPPRHDSSETSANLYARLTEAFAQNRFQDVVGLSRKFIANFPDHNATPSVHLYLGLSYASLQDYHKAIGELRALVARFPQSELAPAALDRIGVYYWQVLRNDAKALDAFQTILARYPNAQKFADNALYYSGIIYSNWQDYEEASAIFKRLINDYPDSDLARRAEVGLKHFAEQKSKRPTRR